METAAQNAIKLWDVATNKELATIKGHHQAVWSLSFSPDGKTLASASWDGTIKLWDVAAGKARATLQARSGWFDTVAFSPDGTTLAYADNGMIKLWDVAAGKEQSQPQRARGRTLVGGFQSGRQDAGRE